MNSCPGASTLQFYTLYGYLALTAQFHGIRINLVDFGVWKPEEVEKIIIYPDAKINS